MRFKTSPRTTLAAAAVSAAALSLSAYNAAASGGGRRLGQDGDHAADRQRPGDGEAREGRHRSLREGQPDEITVKTETRPGGSDGDNLVKTKLSTGDMADVFWYNSGSLLQALSPRKTLVDLTNDPALKDTDPSFLPAVTQNGKVYGAPWGTAMGGGVLYNKDGLRPARTRRCPRRGRSSSRNSEKIKAAAGSRRFSAP